MHHTAEVTWLVNLLYRGNSHRGAPGGGGGGHTCQLSLKQWAKYTSVIEDEQIDFKSNKSLL